MFTKTNEGNSGSLIGLIESPSSFLEILFEGQKCSIFFLCKNKQKRFSHFGFVNTAYQFLDIVGVLRLSAIQFYIGREIGKAVR
jgi:hypothetical protein